MLDKPLASLRNLRVEFETRSGTIVGVEEISFDIAPGETVAVVGESGSGKSVSSLAMMRLVEFGGGEITDGQILFDRSDDGSEILDVAQADNSVMRNIRGNEIGMIFQEPMTSLNPVFTIGRQLTEGLRLHKGMSKDEANERAIELLRQVRIPEPEKRLKQYPHELSGGMRQRVVIAIALSCEPKLLIADEPTTALDVTIQAEILALMNRLKRETGTSVLFITHDMAVVAQMADRVVVMFRGNKVEEGPVEEIFANPKHDYTKKLLAAVPKLGEMKGKPYPEPMRLMHDKTTDTSPVNTVKDEILLDVKNLVTRFPIRKGIFSRVVQNVHAVEDVSFTIRSGETLGMVGESGCGKSTCGRSILRLIEPSAGEVLIRGKDVLKMSAPEMHDARREMQMVFQDPFASLNPKMQLLEQVIEPLRNYKLCPNSEMHDRAANLFDRVHLPRSFLSRYPHEMSGGQRQRVAIARALSLNPSLLVADESVSALDVSVQAEVLNLMLELQKEFGISMLFISHDMAVIERVSHRVAVMYLGRVVEIGPRSAIFENPQHPYTVTLLSAVPVADPTCRKSESDLSFKPIPAPIFSVDYVPEPSRYREVGPDHFVLENE